MVNLEVNITWRIEVAECLISYVDMYISCYVNLKSMITVAIKYELGYVELYLNNRLK
jgi:hypothetical protein